MFGLLEALPQTVNIVDFQYGKTDTAKATPVIGFDVDAMQFSVLIQSLQDGGYPYTEVTSETDVAFRLIHYESKLLRTPYFITLEFHERPGALADFLRAVSSHANLCYFNYVYSGERVGRALLGFEFNTPKQHDQFTGILEAAHEAYRAYERLSETTQQRILG
jgi:threonine dehydratase